MPSHVLDACLAAILFPNAQVSEFFIMLCCASLRVLVLVVIRFSVCIEDFDSHGDQGSPISCSVSGFLRALVLECSSFSFGIEEYMCLNAQLKQDFLLGYRILVIKCVNSVFG